MLSTLIEFLNSGSTAVWLVAVAICVLVFVAVVMFVHAYRSGREISLWPPKIGPRQPSAAYGRNQWRAPPCTRRGLSPRTPRAAAVRCVESRFAHLRAIVLKGTVHEGERPKPLREDTALHGVLLFR